MNSGRNRLLIDGVEYGCTGTGYASRETSKALRPLGFMGRPRSKYRFRASCRFTVPAVIVRGTAYSHIRIAIVHGNLLGLGVSLWLESSLRFRATRWQLCSKMVVQAGRPDCTLIPPPCLYGIPPYEFKPLVWAEETKNLHASTECIRPDTGTSLTAIINDGLSPPPPHPNAWGTLILL